MLGMAMDGRSVTRRCDAGRVTHQQALHEHMHCR